MSLDIYLVSEKGRQNVFGYWIDEGEILYTDNITHNMGKMAAEAGVYSFLWRPDEIDPPVTKANELIEPLSKALIEMIKNRKKYERFNPENNWGSYDTLVEFVFRYLQACADYPNADIEVSR